MRISSLLFIAVLAGCAHRTSTPPPPSVSAAAPKPRALTAPHGAVATVEEALSEVAVRFAFDRDLIEPEAAAALQRLAPVLRRHTQVKVLIAGNCDERGTEEYNLHLGQRRAEAARRYLTALGVSEPQLTTVSYGAEDPVLDRSDEEAWALNRRDDLTVQQDELATAP